MVIVNVGDDLSKFWFIEEGKLYLDDWINVVCWLKCVVEYCNMIILVVGVEVVKCQLVFFEYGSVYLCLMVLCEVVEVIGVYESIVSCVIIGMLIQIFQGILLFKLFFSVVLLGSGDEFGLVVVVCFKIK